MVGAQEPVFVPRSWLTVEELLGETEKQTGLRMVMEVDDELEKMVLYDHLGDLQAVREAAVEYFQFVLGKRVHWVKGEGVWLLRETLTSKVKGMVPLPQPLAQLEADWFDLLRSPTHPLIPADWLEKVQQSQPSISPGEGTVFADAYLREFGRLGPEPVKEVDQIEGLHARDFEVDPHYPKPLLPRLEVAIERGSLESGMGPVELEDGPTELRKLKWRRSSLLLTEWWKALAEQWKRADGRGRRQIKAALEKEDLWKTLPWVRQWMGMPREASPGFSMSPEGGSPQTDAVDELPELLLPEEVISRVPEPDEKPALSPRLPRRILTFSSRNWWRDFWAKNRVKTKEEKAPPPPSRRALDSRDRASEVFEEWRDELRDRRSASRTRRER